MHTAMMFCAWMVSTMRPCENCRERLYVRQMFKLTLHRVAQMLPDPLKALSCGIFIAVMFMHPEYLNCNLLCQMVYCGPVFEEKVEINPKVPARARRLGTFGGSVPAMQGNPSSQKKGAIDALHRLTV
jgi:hypothetical protein